MKEAPPQTPLQELFIKVFVVELWSFNVREDFCYVRKSFFIEKIKLVARGVTGWHPVALFFYVELLRYRKGGAYMDGG